MSLQCLPTSFSSIWLTVWEELSFEEFQDGRHEQNDFSNYESLCHFDASHQVSAQSDMVWEELSSDEFQDALAAILDIGK